ncbi:gag-pol polyprotein [Lasius niger]|uniref:Gag-pol polyprotein n=1 Tax=Lasius niger TaxID=67767 RepID=A0A0J7JYY2_LASNI|nr:gag-pol polyprotein [Lasius niger]
MHIPKEINPRKFDSRSKKCIMVGYADNGYRLWCPEDQRVICGRDVIFDETRFKHYQPVVETNVQEESESEHGEEEFISAIENDQEQSLSETESVNTKGEEETTIKQTANEQQLAPRRSTREKKTPAYLEDYCVLALHAESYVEGIPNCYAEINSRDDREEWQKAVKEELKAIQENETWRLTQLPSGRKAIDNK